RRRRGARAHRRIDPLPRCGRHRRGRRRRAGVGPARRGEPLQQRRQAARRSLPDIRFSLRGLRARAHRMSQAGGTPPPPVTPGEAFWYWFKLGFVSFGGPTGQIAMMHQELVERRRWISERRFLHALNYCMVLPGPEATQLATYIGWLMHRTRGGIVAGGLFVVPGIVSIMALSYVYAGWGRVPIIQALFFGLKAAVLAIVLEAVVRIGRRALKNSVMIALAAAAFLGIFFFGVPFPL